MERLDFEYVVVLDQGTRSALAVGVYAEPGELVAGRVVSATSSRILGTHVITHKDTVIKQVWDDRGEVIEYVPRWWTQQIKASSRYE